MRSLDAPVPPTIELAIAYRGGSRYLAVWQTPGRQLCWFDGTAGGCHSNLKAWESYTHHPRIKPYLHDYRIVHLKENTAGPVRRDQLVLDRLERKFFVGAANDAHAFVLHHNRRERGVQSTEETSAQFRRDWLEEQRRVIDEVQRRSEHPDSLATDITGWLDAQR